MKLGFFNDFNFNKNYLFLKNSYKIFNLFFIKPIASKLYSIGFTRLNNKSKISGEFVDNSYVLSYFHKNQIIQFFIHLRHYRPNFKPFIGKHFRRLNPTIGENGIIISLSRKFSKLTYSIGLDFFKPMQQIYGESKNLNSRFYFYNETKYYNHVFGFDIEQRRFKENLIVENNLLEFQSNQYIIHNKLSVFSVLNKKLFAKYQIIQQKNNIENINSYSFSIRHKGLKIFKSLLKFGIVKFNAPFWVLRLYNYEPGLPGEFQLNANYGNGISLFSVFSYPISDQTNFHFKTSIEKLISKKLTYKMGFQLSVGF